MIVETIEESIECEPVTIKLRKPKVRCVLEYPLVTPANFLSVMHQVIITNKLVFYNLCFLSKHMFLPTALLHILSLHVFAHTVNHFATFFYRTLHCFSLNATYEIK